MVNFCASLIPSSRILDMARRSDAAPGEFGSVLIVTFELAAAQHRTLNGDPIFQFTEAIS
ncbi:VOC family protein [Methylocystis sp. IM2]|uniref:VOC family protein n=1 Tax=Methylocystis sp. IM2 TaxID=3136563 RepID=UPI0030F9D41D